MRLKDSWSLVLFVAVAEAAGLVGSLFTAPAIPGWYVGLAKPALTPPAWVFAPVWTTLFVLMGLAAWLVYVRPLALAGARRLKAVALTLFVGQLALNTLWSMVFFGLRNPAAALAEIGVLWLAILATVIAFAKVSRPAAWLMLPYLLWVSFAAYLNWAIWSLN